MDIKELRVGNWIQKINDEWDYRSTKKNDWIEWADTDFYQLGECGIELKNFKPINFNGSWLEGEGLKVGEWFEDGSFKIKKCKVLGFTIETKNMNTYQKVTFASFRYVHQFQNLYFALTLKELTIN